MNGNIVIIVLMVATVLVLVAGVVLMAVGGKLNQKASNKLMCLRVALQALAVGGMFVLALLMHR